MISGPNFAESALMRAANCSGVLELDVDALRRELVAHLRRRGRLGEQLVQALDRCARGLGGPHQSEPDEVRVDVGMTGLGHGRCVRHLLHSRPRRDGERPQRAGGEVRLARQHADEHHVDAASDQVDHRGRRALVGNMHQRRAAALLEQFAEQMACGADALRRIGQAARLLLGEGDELRHGLGLDGCGHRQHHRKREQRGDRLEVGDRVVLRAARHRRVDHVRGVAREHQRASVRQRVLDAERCRHAAAAGPVLDHDLRAAYFLDLRGDRAHADIG